MSNIVVCTQYVFYRMYAPCTAFSYGKQMIQSYFDTTTSLDILQETALRRGKTYRITLDERAS